MYGFAPSVKLPIAAVVDMVTEALTTKGFGVLTDINVQATMKEANLNIEGRPNRILSACTLPLANRAIGAAPGIGLLLPCNVVMREEPGGQVLMSCMDPAEVLKLVDHPGVAELAQEVKSRLERFRDSLAI